MSKKIPFKIAAVSTLMALPFLTLTSCDSGEVDTGGSSTFELGNRYDAAELAADPLATAEMPRFLLDGDSFQHVVTFSDFEIGAQYLRGFNDNTALFIDDSRQLATTEGFNAVANNTNYIYDPDLSQFTLGKQNSFLDDGLTETELREVFEARTVEIKNATLSQNGSLGAALLEDSFETERQATIFAATAEIIGLAAADIGSEHFDPDDDGDDVNEGAHGTLASARLDRLITYVPTSTNADILATGTISGTVTIVDELVQLTVLENFDGRGPLLTFLPNTVRIRTDDGDEGDSDAVSYAGIASYLVTSTGTFTYNLNSDAF